MTTLLDRHDLVLADLDGTLYQGRAAIPGAVDAVRAAAERGVPTLYVTNNAARSPGDVATHLAELGYPAGADDVATSSQAAAALLAAQLPDGATVLVIGTTALAAEITAVGLTPVGSADGATAVVQGLDPQLRYATLAEACVALRAGAVWVACNIDPTLPSERGPLPGNGSLVAVLRTATRLEPQVAGKPAPALMHTAARRVGASAPLVVGDRLDTDIQGGRAAEMATLLVLTGVSDATELLNAPEQARPDYVGADLGALALDPETLAVGPRPGWTVDGGPDGLVLAGSGDPLDALRTLCARHWDTGGGPPRVRAEGDDAAAALRALGLAPAPGGTASATVAGAETDPRSP
ncbi:MAG: HAD-IIA family hydrolase [Pseudonocardia sp.]|nr:HAD-IIA family hydrolase [Pseudonocardia sp.]